LTAQPTLNDFAGPQFLSVIATQFAVGIFWRDPAPKYDPHGHVMVSR
jgi:hypothetical protein